MDKKTFNKKGVSRTRAGETIREGKVVPETAKIFKDKNGDECYLSGIEQNESGNFYAKIKYIVSGKFLTVEYNKIKQYL